MLKHYLLEVADVVVTQLETLELDRRVNFFAVRSSKNVRKQLVRCDFVVGQIEGDNVGRVDERFRHDFGDLTVTTGEENERVGRWQLLEFSNIAERHDVNEFRA